MSTQTEHYQLSLREGTDIFNPLSTNDNFEKIDELLFQGASGGMVTGTPVVSGGTLSFQGLTLVAADTVVKFKLDASQSVNQVTFAGSTIAIVDLSGNNKTLTGGFWIGYVDTNSKFRVIAWPEVVNAQTFEGQSASYYATKTGLDSVNETAANALSTATAATTVANQALEAAGKGSFPGTLIWENNNLNSGMSANTALGWEPRGGETYLLVFAQPTSTSLQYFTYITHIWHLPVNYIGANTGTDDYFTFFYALYNFTKLYTRAIINTTAGNWVWWSGQYAQNFDAKGQDTTAMIPYRVYKL